jgi:hypothetical protein
MWAPRLLLILIGVVSGGSHTAMRQSETEVQQISDEKRIQFTLLRFWLDFS